MVLSTNYKTSFAALLSAVYQGWSANPCGLFCRLMQVVSLSLSRTTITKTLVSTDCGKFDYSILSLCMRNFSAHFTTGFIVKLYSKLEEKPIRNALIRHQSQSQLEAVSALIL